MIEEILIVARHAANGILSILFDNRDNESAPSLRYPDRDALSARDIHIRTAKALEI